jgi:Tol biopolymer transport system component
MTKPQRRRVLIGLCVLVVCVVGLAFFIKGSAKPEFGPVTYSPDGKYIVFSYEFAKTCFLYRASLESGQATRITAAPDGCESDPSYSADGKLIAYSYRLPEQQKSAIYLVGADGANPHLLVGGGEDDAFPAFSPRTAEIFFLRSQFFGNYDGINPDRRHDIDLFTTDLSGKVQQITSRKYYDASPPSVSPDGGQVIFKTLEDSGDQILIYSTKDIHSPPLVLQPDVPNASKSLGQVSFMPSGQSIVFMSASTGKNGYYDYDVFEMDLKDKKLTSFTTDNGYANGVRPSPDGRFAIFERWEMKNGDPNGNGLFLLDLKTHQISRLNITGIEPQ